jgi:excisionase family DNA binding protein
MARNGQSDQNAKNEQADDGGHIRPSAPGGSSLKMSRSGQGSPDAATPARFLSRQEVARLFGVSVSTVTRWARLGLLKVVRTPGGHYRFPAVETRRAARELGEADLTRLD